MNFEHPVITENKNEKRERRLFEEIKEISLIYANKKFQENKKLNSNYKFSEALKNFSPIKDIILRPTFHLNLINLDKKEYQEKINLFLEDFYNEIDSVYEKNGFNLDNILKIINFKEKTIKKYLGLENVQEFKYDDWGWGRDGWEKNKQIIKFDKITNIKMETDEDMKFSKFDHFIEIHVTDFYKSEEKNLGIELIKKELGIIAENIIDKNPETVAVIGKSWILDTPLADKLGFRRVKNKTNKQNDFSTWSQFINKDGQINQQRLDKFLKSGELPYKSVTAYIKTEEFLKRYLPNSRRGKIILKEIDKEQRDFFEKTGTIKENWTKALENNINFKDFIKNNEPLIKILDIVCPEDKDEYLDFYKTMYDKKVPWTDLYNNRSRNIKIIDEKINQNIQQKMFKDKEIII